MGSITLNGKSFSIRHPGETILDVSQRAGVRIPTLCHHPDLSTTGSCRVCLVELEGSEHLVPACHLPAAEGASILTDSPRVHEARRHTLRFLATRIAQSEAIRDRQPTEFQRLLDEYGVSVWEGFEGQPPQPVDPDPHPFLRLDMNACILCTRCVRACQEVQGRNVWGIDGRGESASIVAGAGTTLLEARCESCGACAAYCPTGAISDRLRKDAPPAEGLVRTTCCYCGVGCQFDLNVADDRIVGVTSNEDAPVNGQRLCVKGRYGYEFIHHPDRLSRPRVRKTLLDNPLHRHEGHRSALVEVDWDLALDIVARRFALIRQSQAGNALALLASAKCSNEENYLAQKFARQVLGTNHVDHCARLCHSSTVAGLQMCYGSGAMSNSLDDVAHHARAFFVIGSNTTEQHPVFGTMLREAVSGRGVPLILADPRRIDLAEFAALHLRQYPGTDVALLNGLMHLILRHGGQDQEFIDARCEEFAPFAASIARYTPEETARITGVPIEQLEHAADLLIKQRPAAVIWAMGITQHVTGVLNVLALGNLQMLLGNIGMPGGGVNPLRGQNNVQGACDMGALPSVFPGYQSVIDVDIREAFAAAWKLDGDFTLPAQPGLTLTEIIDAAGAGRIEGLYIMGENPAATDPDVAHVRECLRLAPFVVVQEIFPSATAEFADVILPGTSFAERSGTFTNTERRVQLFRQAIPPVGAARPDWIILCNLAQRTLSRLGRQPVGPHAEWDYAAPAHIMDEVAALTPSYRGVNWQRLEAGERLQWPVIDASHPGTPILHVDSFTRGKGKFHVVEHLPPAESPDADFPLLLTTGRVLEHWHAGEMTRRVSGLNGLQPCPVVEISVTDARRYAVVDGELIELHSRRGFMRGMARVSDRVPEGVVFSTFHFPGVGNINEVTHKALDPLAKIPEYKVCAVRLTRLPDSP